MFNDILSTNDISSFISFINDDNIIWYSLINSTFMRYANMLLFNSMDTQLSDLINFASAICIILAVIYVLQFFIVITVCIIV